VRTTSDKHPWKRSQTGAAKRGRARQAGAPVGHTCPTPGCGLPADQVDHGDPTIDGWITTGVIGSTDPARLWCDPRCAAVGIARAQLRTSAPAAAPRRAR
jgi:hypothetical protein